MLERKLHGDLRLHGECCTAEPWTSQCHNGRVVKLADTTTCLSAFDLACPEQVVAIRRVRVQVPPPVLF